MVDWLGLVLQSTVELEESLQVGVDVNNEWYKNNYSIKNSDGQIDFIVCVFHSSLHVSHDFYVNR